MEYNREVLVARVVELRDKHRMSFAMIADTMNAEGYTLALPQIMLNKDADGAYVSITTKAHLTFSRNVLD